MCKKQTSVSHSSTESEIMSLDARLRMDGLLALDLWDIVIELLRSTNNNVKPKHTSIQETGATLHSKTKAQKVKRTQKVDQLSDVDYVPTNTHSSHNESQLYIFEDNEAVIRMLIKGRSPTMRHVSKTHRVDLDWFCDRNILEPKIQIKYVDTRNQLADILTKGCFPRDEWNHLLCLFNIMDFSMYSFSHFSDLLSDDQVRKQSAMCKRGQKTASNEGSPTAKAKPCLVLREQRSEEISSRSLGSLFNPMKEKKSYKHPGTWCYPTQIQKSGILKQIDKRMFRNKPGNWCWKIETKQKVMRENFLTPQAQGHPN